MFQVEKITTQLDAGSIVLLTSLGYSASGEVFNVRTEEVRRGQERTQTPPPLHPHPSRYAAAEESASSSAESFGESSSVESSPEPPYLTPPRSTNRQGLPSKPRALICPKAPERFISFSLTPSERHELEGRLSGGSAFEFQPPLPESLRRSADFQQALGATQSPVGKVAAIFLLAAHRQHVLRGRGQLLAAGGGGAGPRMLGNAAAAEAAEEERTARRELGILQLTTPQLGRALAERGIPLPLSAGGAELTRDELEAAYRQASVSQIFSRSPHTRFSHSPFFPT